MSPPHPKFVSHESVPVYSHEGTFVTSTTDSTNDVSYYEALAQQKNSEGYSCREQLNVGKSGGENEEGQAPSAYTMAQQLPQHVLNDVLLGARTDQHYPAGFEYFGPYANEFSTNTEESITNEDLAYSNQMQTYIRPGFEEVVYHEECQVTHKDVVTIKLKWRAQYMMLAGEFYLRNKMIDWKRKSLESERHAIANEKGDMLRTSLYWDRVKKFQQYEEHQKLDMRMKLRALDMERIEENRIKRLMTLYNRRCWEQFWASRIPDEMISQKILSTRSPFYSDQKTAMYPV